MSNQIPDYFLKKKEYIQFLKSKQELKSLIFEILKIPIINFNDIRVDKNCIYFRVLKNKIFIELKKINIGKALIEKLYINLWVPDVIDNIHLKNYTQIEKFIINIYLNKNSLYLKIYMRIYDIRIHTFKQFNKQILFDLKKTPMNLLFKDSKKVIFLEFWNTDFIDTKIWCFLKINNL